MQLLRRLEHRLLGESEGRLALSPEAFWTSLAGTAMQDPLSDHPLYGRLASGDLPDREEVARCILVLMEVTIGFRGVLLDQARMQIGAQGDSALSSAFDAFFAHDEAFGAALRPLLDASGAKACSRSKSVMMKVAEADRRLRPEVEKAYLPAFKCGRALTHCIIHSWVGARLSRALRQFSWASADGARLVELAPDPMAANGARDVLLNHLLDSQPARRAFVQGFALSLRLHALGWDDLYAQVVEVHPAGLMWG